MKENKKYIPNKNRAVISGKIAVIRNGRRYIEFYKSGEPLRGKIEYTDVQPRNAML